LCTFIASSVWHGTYPGFIVCFIGAALLEIQCKNLPKLKLTQTLSAFIPQWALATLGYLWCAFVMAYFGMSFVFLTFDKFNLMHKNLNYSLHYLMPLVTLFAIYMPKVRNPSASAADGPKEKAH
jgi:hypothetical protein